MSTNMFNIKVALRTIGPIESRGLNLYDAGVFFGPQNDATFERSGFLGKQTFKQPMHEVQQICFSQG